MWSQKVRTNGCVSFLYSNIEKKHAICSVGHIDPVNSLNVIEMNLGSFQSH